MRGSLCVVLGPKYLIFMLARKYVKALRRKELLEEKEKCKREVQEGNKKRSRSC